MQRAALFMQLWTLKEAFVKAKGIGISAPPGLKGFSIGGYRSACAADSLYFRRVCFQLVLFSVFCVVLCCVALHCVVLCCASLENYVVRLTIPPPRLLTVTTVIAQASKTTQASKKAEHHQSAPLLLKPVA